MPTGVPPDSNVPPERGEDCIYHPKRAVLLPADSFWVEKCGDNQPKTSHRDVQASNWKDGRSLQRWHGREDQRSWKPSSKPVESLRHTQDLPTLTQCIKVCIWSRIRQVLGIPRNKKRSRSKSGPNQGNPWFEEPNDSKAGLDPNAASNTFISRSSDKCKPFFS